MAGDGFSDTINQVNLATGRDLPTTHPGRDYQATAGAKDNFTCKYARFVVDEAGCEALEAVMDACLSGKYLLATEKWHFTKEGDAVVVVKYLIPEKRPAKPESTEIHGQRRLRKALQRQGTVPPPPTPGGTEDEEDPDA